MSDVTAANAQVPWWVGGNGATNVTRTEMQRRAREILSTQTYQDSLERRIKSDTLPPAVETMLYYYAYGKPVEQVALTVNEGRPDLSQMTTEQLADLAQSALSVLEELKAQEASLPAEFRQTA